MVLWISITNSEQQRIQNGMFRYNLLGKAEILSNFDVKKGIRILENNTLKKQNLPNETTKNIQMKKHISEKVFHLYLSELKMKEQKKKRKFKKYYEMNKLIKKGSDQV